MPDNLRPEDKLRLIRAQARSMFGELDLENEDFIPPPIAEPVTVEPPAPMLPAVAEKTEPAVVDFDPLRFEPPPAEPRNDRMHPEQLANFLRSLGSILHTAIEEVRDTSRDLAALSAEIDRLERRKRLEIRERN